MKLYFQNDETADRFFVGEVLTFAQASEIIEASDDEGGEAVIVTENGDEYYYCPSDDGDWFLLD